MENIVIDRLVRSKRRTIALLITPEATLVVRAPLRTPLEYIERVVVAKHDWILKKIQQVATRPPLRSKEYRDGEQLLFLGEHYTLRLTGHKAIQMLGAELLFPARFVKQGRTKLIAWYSERARHVIGEQAEHFSRLTGWKYSSLKITHAEKRWGSCSPSGAINFSWKLMMAPLDIIDYVVVHELAHLVEKNHSPKFWQLVERVLPDYPSRRKWLRTHQAEFQA